MDYQQAIAYIHSTQRFGSKLGLENISRLLNEMGNPHRELHYIHVAGTNGKGSICAMLSAVLTQCGYRTGLYVSPCLENFEERIQLNGNPISKEVLAEITTFVADKVNYMIDKGYDSPTEFEIVMAIAFEFYKRQKTEVVVLETGLGGRLDATNVIEQSLVSVITSISMDHMDRLGNTIEKIAAEKSAIIKPRGYVCLYPDMNPKALQIILDEADRKDAAVLMLPKNTITCLSYSLESQQYEYGYAHSALNINKIILGLKGKYQRYNLLCTLSVLEVLVKTRHFILPSEKIIKALQEVCFPGRFEVLHEHPVILIDGGHNPEGIQAFVENIKVLFDNQKITLFFGMLSNKDIQQVLKDLVPIVKKFILMKPPVVNGESIERLEKQIYEIDATALVEKEPDIDKIMQHIDLKDKEEIYAFVGSLYLIGPVRTILKKHLK